MSSSSSPLSILCVPEISTVVFLILMSILLLFYLKFLRCSTCSAPCIFSIFLWNGIALTVIGKNDITYLFNSVSFVFKKSLSHNCCKHFSERRLFYSKMTRSFYLEEWITFFFRFIFCYLTKNVLLQSQCLMIRVLWRQLNLSRHEWLQNIFIKLTELSEIW